MGEGDGGGGGGEIKDLGLSFFRLYSKKDNRFENLSEEEYEAFINLQSNNNIIIQKSDHGNSLVVIDRLSYVNEMEKLLNDCNKFVQIDFNPFHKVSQDIRPVMYSEVFWAYHYLENK